jgi:hypothetical protein
MRAPKGKLDFIGGLQPYFKAKEVIFAKELPDLRDQLLGFPTGRIDVPNALAYALKLKPGQPVQENFSAEHVYEGLRKVAGIKPWLLLHMMSGGVGAVIVQWGDGVLYVLADWFREGHPGDVVPALVSEARLEVGNAMMTAVLPPVHFEKYNNVGLAQAVRKVPMEAQQGGAVGDGIDKLSDLLSRKRKGFPSVRISSSAAWTLNGLAGGYCKYLSKMGVLEADAEPGPYKVIIEAIESFVSLTSSDVLEDRRELEYEFTDTGRRYLSARRM